MRNVIFELRKGDCTQRAATFFSTCKIF